MDLGLKGLNVLISGGSKGIGRRCADYFAQEGANVSICARDKATVDETVAHLSKSGVKALGHSVDVGNKAALEIWIAESAKALGGIAALQLQSNDWLVALSVVVNVGPVNILAGNTRIGRPRRHIGRRRRYFHMKYTKDAVMPTKNTTLTQKMKS